MKRPNDSADARVEIARSVWIDAPPDVVFEYFTEADLFAYWMAGLGDADVDARPGGALSMTVAGERRLVAEYVAVDRPHRVVFTWGWEGHDVLPPGGSRVEVTLDPEGGGTRLHLRHTGLPASEEADMAGGWDHYLGRLGSVARGEAPRPDPWTRQRIDREGNP